MTGPTPDGQARQLALFANLDDAPPWAESPGLALGPAYASRPPGEDAAPRPPAPALLPFRPLPWQISPWRNTDPVLLLTGSAGGGKSRLAAEKLHAYCQRYPGAMALMLRKTRESMVNSTVLFMARRVVGADRYVRHVPSRHRFEYANGSILAYGGMADEAQREQVRSIGQDGGLDIAWMEEASRFSEADYNELLPRMRGKAAPWRQIILTTNPDGPRHWINLRLIQGGEATVCYSHATDNAHNPPDYAARLDGLTGIQRLRLRDGHWAQAEGVVYSGWDPAVHVVDTERLRGWGIIAAVQGTAGGHGALVWPPAQGVHQVVASVDWGYTNPGTIQVWAVDGDGRMYLLHEVYQRQRLVDWWIGRARALGDHLKIELYACDPSQPAYIAALRAAGLNAQSAENAVAPGIQRVQARLALQGDGRPRLYLLRGALEEVDPSLDAQGRPTCLEQELAEYVWATRPEEPLRVNDHGCDALRYAVMAVQDLGPTVEYLRLAF